MSSDESQDRAARILAGLECVARERERRRASAEFAQRVALVKTYQQARFRRTYADLLSSERYRLAAQFFLDELYGPADFTHRDAQFARIVPRLVRMLPSAVLEAVRDLADLHALSEQLDSAMGEALVGDGVDACAYVRAWQRVGNSSDRLRQIELVISIGSALDGFAHMPLIATSLRLMRGPARAAELADLQRFLECGLDAFRSMRGARDFLSIVGTRERALSRALFDFPVDPASELRMAECARLNSWLPGVPESAGERPESAS